MQKGLVWMMTTIRLKPLLFHLALPLAVGGAAALLTRDQTGIVYQSIEQPLFSPPGWVFPVVWTILYILMGVAAYLIQVTPCRYSKKALNIYWCSLVVNFLWPVVFFQLQQFTLALVLLIVLWGLVFAAAAFYSLCNKTACILMIPYLLWLSFAAYLNMAIVCLN